MWVKTLNCKLSLQYRTFQNLVLCENLQEILLLSLCEPKIKCPKVVCLDQFWTMATLVNISTILSLGIGQRRIVVAGQMSDSDLHGSARFKNKCPLRLVDFAFDSLFFTFFYFLDALCWSLSKCGK